jgi:hypothetical protein
VAVRPGRTVQREVRLDQETLAEVGPGTLWCPGGDMVGKLMGYRLDPEIGVWVHAACGLPSKAVYFKHIERGDWDIIGLIG